MLSKVSLECFRAFLKVADEGGFTAAAEKLGVTKNQLSREVAKLESELGLSVFVRTTRKVVLTDAGQRLRDMLHPLLSKIDAETAHLADAKLRGALRITAPADYLASVLCPLLVEFAALHPEIAIDLVSDNKIRDLVADRIDVAVRLGWLRDSSLRAVKVGRFELVAVASPTYLERHAAPQRPADLACHPFIGLGALPDPGVFRFAGAGGASHVTHLVPRFLANTVEALLSFARAGAGVAITTDFSATGDLASGTLRRVLTDWRIPPGGVYLVWPRAKQESVKVRALLTYLRGRLTTA